MSVRILCLTTLVLLFSTQSIAASTCDSAVTKAVGKEIACLTEAIAKGEDKGVATDAAKITKCRENFLSACTNGKEAADCRHQSGTCADIDAAVDAAVAELTRVSCGANGSCTVTCPGTDINRCLNAGCPSNRCVGAPQGDVCLEDNATGSCTTSADCPEGRACNGETCELVCNP